MSKPASTAVRTLPYMGGKSHLNYGSGRWVASMLPQETDGVTYCEPCCGLAKILIQRRPSSVEIINDINDRIVNYLTVVRDHTEQIAWRTEYTPISESEFQRAIAGIDSHADPIERARFFHILVEQSMLHTDNRLTFAIDWGRDGSRNRHRIPSDDVIRLGRRLADVQILCRDGVDGRITWTCPACLERRETPRGWLFAAGADGRLTTVFCPCGEAVDMDIEGEAA